MTSQDAIHSFFLPAFRIKQERTAEALYHHLVSGSPSPGSITCSVPNIAGPSILE